MSYLDQYNRLAGKVSPYRPVNSALRSPASFGSSSYGAATQSFTDRVYDRKSSSIERFQPLAALDNIVGTTAGAIGYAAQVPARVLETPFSILGEAAEGLWKVPSSPLYGIKSGIEGSPVGAGAGFLGDLVTTVSNSMSAALNKNDMEIMRLYGDRPDDFVIPAIGPRGEQYGLGEVVDDPDDWAPGFLGMFGIGRQKTMGEFRQELYNRGFTDDDFNDVRTGHKTPWEFGDKAANDSFMVEMAQRFTLDPFNLVFFGAGGVGAKLARMGMSPGGIMSAYGRLRGSAIATERAAKGVGSLTPVTLQQATEAAIAANWSKATTIGFAEALKRPMTEAIAKSMATAVNLGSRQGLATAAKGTAKFFLDPRGYASRKGYFKRAAALYGITGVAQVIPFEDPVSRQVREFSRGVQENQPFSQNNAFILTSALATPVVSAGREALHDTGQILRNTGFARSLPTVFERGFKRPFNQIVERLGGEAAFNQEMRRTAQQIVLEELQATNPTVASFSSLPVSSNRLEAILGPMLEEITDQKIRQGDITGQMIFDKIKDFVENPTLPGGGKSPVRFDFGNGDLYLDTMRTWRRESSVVMQALRGNSDYNLGLRQTFAKEDIDLLALNIQELAGTQMTSAEFQSWLRRRPGLMNADPVTLPGLVVKAQDRGFVTHAEIIDALAEVRKNPLVRPIEELYNADRMLEIQGILDTPVRPMYAMDDLRMKMSALRDSEGNVLPDFVDDHAFLAQQFELALAKRVRGAARRSIASREQVKNTLYAESQAMRAAGMNDLADKTVAAMNQLATGVRPLRRDVADLKPHWIAKIKELTAKEGGSTINPYTGRRVKKGISVGVAKETFRKVDPADELAVQEALQDVAREYPGHMIGTWMDNGVMHIDPVRIFTDEGQARSYAARYEQEAYFDLATGKETRLADLAPDDIPAYGDDVEDFLDWMDRYDRSLVESQLPTPVLGERAGEQWAVTRRKLEQLEARLRAINSPYEISKMPRVRVPREVDTGPLPEVLMRQQSAVAKALFSDHALMVPFRMIEGLLSKVPGAKMAADTRSAFHREFIKAGATVKDADAFMNALVEKARTTFVIDQNRGLRAFPSPTNLTRPDIQTVAMTVFPDASHPARAAFGDNFAGVLDRASSRTLRRLQRTAMGDPNRKNGPIPTGALRRLARDMYHDYRSGFRDESPVSGKLAKVTYNVARRPGRPVASMSRMVSNTFYNIFRFMSDPRWYVFNWYEQSILGLFKEGIDGKPGSSHISQAARRAEQGQWGSRPILDAEETAFMHHNKYVSSRVARTFDKSRENSTLKVIEEMWDTDAYILSLRQKFPTADKRTLSEMIDQNWIDFDTKGVGKTVRDEWNALFESGKLSEMDRAIAGPLITRITEVNKATYKSVVQMMMGNPDRRNIERIANSYWLYWPISYQLKAARWLLSTMTERAFGKNTNMYGAWKYAEMKEYFIESLATNPEFQRQLDDGALWGAAMMLFPITPEDMGVSLNRIVRAAGGATSVFDPIEDSRDPLSWIAYGAEVGLFYTADLLRRVGGEVFEEPEIAPVPLARQLDNSISEMFQPQQPQFVGVPQLGPITSNQGITINGQQQDQGANPYDTPTFDEGGDWIPDDEYEALMQSREAYDSGG